MTFSARRWSLFVSRAALVLAAAALLAAPITQRSRPTTSAIGRPTRRSPSSPQNPGATVQIRDAADQSSLHRPDRRRLDRSEGTDGPSSGDTVWWVDFSRVRDSGHYHLYSPTLGGQSYEFEVRGDVYDAAVARRARDLLPAALQHAQARRPRRRLGRSRRVPHVRPRHDRGAGHTNQGPLDLRGGWHDAGDYNKYVWGAASTAVLLLLRAYEDNPGVFADGTSASPSRATASPTSSTR